MLALRGIIVGLVGQDDPNRRLTALPAFGKYGDCSHSHTGMLLDGLDFKPVCVRSGHVGTPSIMIPSSDVPSFL